MLSFMPLISEISRNSAKSFALVFPLAKNSRSVVAARGGTEGTSRAENADAHGNRVKELLC